MIAVAAVHEYVDDGTEQQDRERQDPEQVRSMLGPEEEHRGQQEQTESDRENRSRRSVR
ncbi:MAG: hypothetical protein R2752_13210 [Vicinamibacterales bacterium]